MSKTNPQLLIESGGVNNLSASFNSDAFYLGGNCLNFSVQANTDAGTHGGTLKVQVSNDGTNWVDLTSATTTLSSGTDPAWLHNAADVGFMWMRLAYTFSSGNGQLDAQVSQKRSA